MPWTLAPPPEAVRVASGFLAEAGIVLCPTSGLGAVLSVLWRRDGGAMCRTEPNDLAGPLEPLLY